MAALRQLSKEDVLFVAGETDTVYQHTAGLAILDASGVPDFNFESFRERIIERIDQVPQFRWKLQEVPLNLDLPYWVEDENFNYKHHFKRIAVPSPGDREALAEVVAHLYSKHMDRSKPLWELWLIEGLADGKYAMLQKSHHCMMDGEGATQLSEILCDLEPDAAPTPVDDSIANARAGEVPSQWQISANTALHLARLPQKVSRGIVDFLRPRLLWQLGRGKTAEPVKPMAPATSFNGEIGSERGFVFGALPLADVKSVKTAFGVSINDVILGLVGSAMRNYLLAHSELPDASLRTSIIVSNVRSSSAPLYIAGARMEAVHPMSIITQGIGINITCVSYADTVGFGVTIDPELVPQPWDIVDGLGAALQEYVALAKKAARQGKAAARKKRPAKNKAATGRKAATKTKTKTNKA